MRIAYEIHNSYKKIKNFPLNIKNHFKNSFNTIHKARNELKVIEYGEFKTVVKAFKVPNALNQIVYAYFRGSKAKKSYENAIKLRNLGLNTPQPICYIEFYKNFLFKESFFVSEKLDYDFTIREVLRNLKLENRELIIKKFVQFTYNLHKNNIYHKDYSAGNILVVKKQKDYEFFIVDINRMEFKNIDLKVGLNTFSKLWLDKNSLLLIAKEYSKVSQIKEQKIIDILKKCDKNLKNFVEFKRKIRFLR